MHDHPYCICSRIISIRAKAKTQKLSADFKSNHRAQVSDPSARSELDLYLDMLLDLEDNGLNAVKFWNLKKKNLCLSCTDFHNVCLVSQPPVDQLNAYLAMDFMRQHRDTLSTDHLCNIIFLKYNC